MKPSTILAAAVVAFAGLALQGFAQPIASDDLEIRGMTLEVVTTSLDANVGTPTYVQTRFGGVTDGPVTEGLVAEGDLSGPGLAEPITLRTAPGHRFEVPGLPGEGDYLLGNVRLTRDGKWVGDAIPSFATIRVSNTLRTEVKIRQLTPEELRARGIVLDLTNFDCYQYTLTVYQADGTPIQVEYPVVVDKRTRETYPLASDSPYRLPPIGTVTPPRWTPPAVAAFDLDQPIGDQLPPPAPATGDGPSPARPSIPAALVLPGNLAVLHQFFSVGLTVANGAPAGSPVRLEGAGATIRPPSQLRIAKSDPAAAPGTAVALRSASGGALLSQEEGRADWTVEGLESGTWTLDIDVRATMTQPGQPDVVLQGRKSAAIVVHDPRFNITFTHPPAIVGATDWLDPSSVYPAWAFVTNLSPVAQTVTISTQLAACGASPQNLCLADPLARSVTLTLAAGETRDIEYRLKSQLSGNLVAASTAAQNDAVSVSFRLQGGEALAPATLLMPWYARYLDDRFIAANLQLLGRGWAIATAPLSGTTASYPRVITTDVFSRAIDISRAGQRVFITESESLPADSRAGRRFAFANLALDLLGARDGRRSDGEPLEHRNALAEWDALRRQESENGRSGRSAGAALARQLESTIEPGDSHLDAFDRFAATNAHRSDFVAALVYGGNAKLAFRSAAGTTTGINDAGGHPYARRVPFADVHGLLFPDGSRAELGLVGHAPSLVELVLSADGPFSLELVYPGGELGTPLRLSETFVSAGAHTYTLRLLNGTARIEARDEDGSPFPVSSGRTLALPVPGVVAARQDLYLDPEGHKVSLLFNRPIRAGDGDLFRKFEGEVVFTDGTYSYRGPRPVSAAALQDDGRVVNLTFDHALHANVSRRAGSGYVISPRGALTDPVSGAGIASVSIPPVRIDNDRPAALFYGRVIAGDGTPIPDADVVLSAGPPQYDRSSAGHSGAPVGAFFFEYVPRDPAAGYSGAFSLRAITPEGKATSTSGTIRTPGAVYPVDLQFLGRGSAEGFVRYDDTNAPAAGARVVVGSALFNQFRTAIADAAGFFRVSDVPVGPVTFSATDDEGNVVYAANEVSSPGEVVTQNLTIHRAAFAGLGNVRGVVIRSDASQAPIAGAHVGVYSQGFGLIDGLTDAAGRFEFRDVPAGFVTLLAEQWTVAYESAALDFELRRDATQEVTLVLPVRDASVSLTRVEGAVTRGVAGSGEIRSVPGALVQIDGMPVATADAQGKYVYDSVPSSHSGRRVRAWDPETKRIGEAELPTLRADVTNNAPIHIAAGATGGEGTVRVTLLDAAGRTVSKDEYAVYEIGTQGPELSGETEPGVFTKRGVVVGTTVGFIAVPRITGGRYGEQFASGAATVEIDGQIVSRTLRLPGQGQILVSLQSAGTKQLGPVRLDYTAWDDALKELAPRSRTLSTADPAGSGIAGYARFTGVPVRQRLSVSADLAQQGNASASAELGWDGQTAQLDLQLGTRARVRGRVLHFDGVTPVEGAVVTIEDGVSLPASTVTAGDGSFEFGEVAPGVEARVTANFHDGGISRTGFAAGRTPPYGGSVDGFVVTLRRRANVEGRIVFGDRKPDPADPTRTVEDDTPGDLSDNAPIARASFWLSEIAFPNRSFGSESSPLHADADGNFVVANVFEGPFRVTASHLDESASVAGVVELDGVDVPVLLGVGVDGAGSIEARVIDPNEGYRAAANAEVTLIRDGSAFDFGSADASGLVRFTQVPARGAFRISAYSKALGRSGSSAAFDVVAGETRLVEVLLERSGSVSGALTDDAESGAGVIGAHVDLAASGYATRATSSGDGAFLFAGVREGSFRLEARDPSSNRRASGGGAVSLEQPDARVDLRLPRWGSLAVNAWQPNDQGSASATPAYPVAIDVKQLCYNHPATNVLTCEQLQSLQGSAVAFDRVLPSSEFLVEVRELGGTERRVTSRGTVGPGEARRLDLVLPAFGRVKVRVINRDTRTPMSNVRVQVNSEGVNFVGFTDANGEVLAGSFALNRAVWVGAATADGLLSGNALTTIASASLPAEVTIELASLASLTGFVGAEAGGPSIGTRVIVQGNVETVTDGAGNFTLGGFVTGRSVDLVYLGPDGETVGARQSFTPSAPGANRVPPVRLDSTPPRIVSITPADGASEVSLEPRIAVVFSEPLSPSSLSGSNFALAPNGSAQMVALRLSTWTDPSGYVVSLEPAAPLLSHTLYRLMIAGTVTDLSGHTLGAAREVSFTTSDLTGPSLVRVTPDLARPVPTNVPLVFEFSEELRALDGTSGAPSVVTVTENLASSDVPDAFIAGSEVAGFVSLYGEPRRFLSFAPCQPGDSGCFVGDRVAFAKGRRYRVVVSGVRDARGNPFDSVAFDFRTFDDVKPHVAIVAPSPATTLVAGIVYTVELSLVDSDSNGVPTSTVASDIDRVEYFEQVAGAWRLAEIVRPAPGNPHCSWNIVAPTGGAAYVVRAIAWDTSSNSSLPAEVSWSVVPDLAPAEIALLTSVRGTVVGSAHAGSDIRASLRFAEEGLVATYSISAVAVKDGVTLFTAVPQSGELRKLSDGSWPAVEYPVTLPKTLPAGAVVEFTATVVDSKGQSGSGSAQLSVLTDSGAPSIVAIVEPSDGDLLYELSPVQLAIRAADPEVGVKEVAATLGTVSATLVPVAGTDEFRGELRAPDVTSVDDAPFVLTFVAKDFAGNASAPAGVNVLVRPSFDPTTPVLSWLCGSDRAVMPAGESLPLRVRAVPGSGSATEPPSPIAEVAFYLDDASVPFDVRPTSADGTYETTVPASLLVAGQTVVVTAKATNGNGKSTSMSSSVKVVTATNVTGALFGDGDRSHDGSSIYVMGGTLTIAGSHQFENLIVLAGGRVTHVRSAGLAVTATTVFVACGGTLDGDDAGYAAGATHPGHVASSGGAGGSHLGIGGDRGDSGEPGSTFGSVTRPDEPGGGGSACCGGGGTRGGGRVAIAADAVLVEGRVGADGGDPKGIGGAGAGGSVRIVAGWLGGRGRIEARGFTGSASGGGGAIAVEYGDGDARGLDLNAQGAVDSDPAMAGESAAGAIWVKSPESTYGTLTIDNRDVSNARGTVLPALGSGVAAPGSGPVDGAVRLVLADARVVPGFFAGHWIEIRESASSTPAYWLVDGISRDTSADRAILLLRPEVAGTAPFTAGALWQGVYRFDAVGSPKPAKLVSADPIRVGVGGVVSLRGPASGELAFGHPIDGETVTIDGNVITGAIHGGDVAVNGALQAPDLDVRTLLVAAGARLSSLDAPGAGLTITASESVTLSPPTATAPGGSIDLSGRGFGSGATLPGEMSSRVGSGGSHLGQGGIDPGATSSARGGTYGSITRPQEPGAGGAAALVSYGSAPGGRGGGRLKLTSGALELGGSILANGASYSGGAGAGGSIWLDVDVLRGNGRIEASGGAGGTAYGAGGAIAIEYALDGGGSWSSNVVASGKQHASSTHRSSAPGSVWVKGPGATHGALRLNNGTVSTESSVRLPSFGFDTVGAVAPGGTIELAGMRWIPPYFAGHWIEVLDDVGAPRGSWKILGIDNRSTRVLPDTTLRSTQGATYSGYLVYSAQTQLERFGMAAFRGQVEGEGREARVFAARYESGEWLYDSGGDAYVKFVPLASDRVIARFSQDGGGHTSLANLACDPGGCGQVGGIPVAQVVGGELLGNTSSIDQFGRWNFRFRGTIQRGSPAIGDERPRISLDPGSAGLTGIVPGDPIRGVYRLDSLQVGAGVKLQSSDPIQAPGFAMPAAALSFATGQPSAVFAGSTIKVVVTASDAQALQRVTLRAAGPVVPASAMQARSVTGVATVQSFDVTTLTSAAPNEMVTMLAEVTDELGTVVATRALAVTIVADEVPPSIGAVTFTPDSSELRYPAGTTIGFVVAATDNVGVASVEARINGATLTDSSAPYQFSWSAPKVSVDTVFELVVTARDPQGNVGTASRTLLVVPASGGSVPGVVWNFPTADATVPAGYPVQLEVTAADDAGVVAVEFFEEDSPQPFHRVDAPDFSSRSLTVRTSRILPAQEGVRQFRVRVHDISTTFTEGGLTLTSVAAVPINASNPDWATLETTRGVLASGTLTTNAKRRMAGLFVLSGATVAHGAYSSTFDTKAVDLDVAGDLWVERGGKINVSGRGFAANVTYQGAVAPGGASGGSHIGNGGVWNVPASTVFGSVTRPMEPGGGGGQEGSVGGGVIRLTADRAIIDGTIAADGSIYGVGGGAGGSVWIVARELGGSGEINARGAGDTSNAGGGGGGGAIALRYETVSGDRLPVVRAHGGVPSGGRVGSAGTIVVATGTLAHPKLVVDNNGIGGSTNLPSLGSGTAAAGSAGARIETGRSVSIPPYFAGHWVEVRSAGGEPKGRWRAKAASGFALELEPNAGEVIDVQPGDLWQGVYVFSAVETFGGASLNSVDPVRIDVSEGN